MTPRIAILSSIILSSLLAPNVVAASCSGLSGDELAACEVMETEMMEHYRKSIQRSDEEVLEFHCEKQRVGVARRTLRQNNPHHLDADYSAICEHWPLTGTCVGHNQEIQCKAGKPNGYVRRFDPNNKLQFEGVLRNGFPQQTRTWAADGTLQTAIDYKSQRHIVGCRWQQETLIARWEYLGEDRHGYWLEVQPGGRRFETYYRKGQLRSLPKSSIDKDCPRAASATR